MSPGSSTLHKKRSFKNKRSKTKSKAKRSTTRGQRRGRTSPKRISRKGTRTEPSPRPLRYRHEEVRAYRGDLNVSCLNLSTENLSQQTEENLKTYENVIKDALTTVQTNQRQQKIQEEERRKQQREIQQKEEKQTKREEKLKKYENDNQVHRTTFLKYINSVLSNVQQKTKHISEKSRILSLNEILASAQGYADVLHPVNLNKLEFNIDQVAWILFGLVLSLPLSKLDNINVEINVKIGEDQYPDYKGGYHKQEYFQDVTPLLDEIMMASRSNPFQEEAINYLVNDKHFNNELMKENSLMLSTLQDVYPFNSQEWKSFLEEFNNVKDKIENYETMKKYNHEVETLSTYKECLKHNTIKDCNKLFKGE